MTWFQQNWWLVVAIECLIHELESELATRDARLAELKRNLAAAQRELERWRHGQPIEGDYVCPNSLRAINASSRCEELEQQLIDDHDGFEREREQRENAKQGRLF